MKKLVFFILAFFIFVSVSGFGLLLDSGVRPATCSSGSGTTILGYETAGTDTTINADDIRCAQYTTIAGSNYCTIDELPIYTGSNHTSGETVTAGLYSTGGTKLVDSDAVVGDATNSFKVTTLDSPYEITASTNYVICAGAKVGGFYVQYTNTGSGWTKVLSGETWSAGTLPTSLDFSSPSTGYQYRMYGTNP